MALPILLTYLGLGLGLGLGLLVASLPLFIKAFSLTKSLGVAWVILGVITINSRPARAPEQRRSAP
jgi:undecaprenyl phosphate-alpha-L-ara4N flippase subunit ArnF